jgi:hypothetical protein
MADEGNQAGTEQRTSAGTGEENAPESPGDSGDETREERGEEGRTDAGDVPPGGPDDEVRRQDSAGLLGVVQAIAPWRQVVVANAIAILAQADGDQDVVAAVLLEELTKMQEKKPRMVVALAATALAKLAAVQANVMWSDPYNAGGVVHPAPNAKQDTGPCPR